VQKRLSLQQETALLVVGVEPGSAAEKGGILLGDVLVGVGEQSITRTGDLQTALAIVGAGKVAAVKVVRGGESKALNVTLGERGG
jgi:serine protease Do